MSPINIVHLLFIPFLLSAAWQDCKPDLSQKNSSPKIALNISFNYASSNFLDTLEGVNVDRLGFEKINRSLFNVAKENNFNITDTEMKDSTVSRNPHNLFISQLENFKKENPNAPLNVNFSGHGIACCYDQKVQWCALLPGTSKDEIVLSKSCGGVDGEFLDLAIPRNQAIAATQNEIIDILKPQSLIIDACRSGAVSATIRSVNDKRVDGLFLLSSTASFLDAPDTSQGGLLFSTLNEIAEGDMPNQCVVDLDQDGAVSERELSLFLLMKNIRDGSPDKKFPAVDQLKLQKVSAQASGTTALTVATAKDKCVMNTPQICPSVQNDGENSCTGLNKTFLTMNKSLLQLQTSPQLLGISKREGSKNKGVKVQKITKCAVRGVRVKSLCEPPTPEQGKIAVDQRKSEATQFISDWSTELLKKQNSVCSGIHCESFNQLNKTFDYLQEIVTFL